MVERETALALLKASSSNERLRGARALRTVGLAEDIPAIQHALFREENRWVKIALRNLLAAEGAEVVEAAATDTDTDAEDTALFLQMKAEGVLETTHSFYCHAVRQLKYSNEEIRPIVFAVAKSAAIQLLKLQ